MAFLGIVRKTVIITVFTVGFLLLLTTPVFAQEVGYAKRVVSKDSQWLLPVADNILCSDEQRHINRGSVRAWDLCVPFGSAVYPISDGKVEYAGCSNAGGYGCWMYINHGNGFRAIYAHMDTGSIRVKRGDLVKQNQIIARVGWTGMTSFGPHTHLEIHHTSGRVVIGDYFDRRLMKVCNLCNVPKGKPLVASGTLVSNTSSGQGIKVNSTWLVAILVLGVCFFMYTPKNAFLSGAYMGTGLALVTVSIGILPFLELETRSVGNASYQQIHAIVQGWEGNKCTVDPVKTFAGVTQWTYNRYRMEQQKLLKDVCTITKPEIEDIYYRYYWLASGANKLPTRFAITYYDFSINAGLSAAKAGLAKCGTDARCFNNYRVSYYRSLKFCYLYCKGWLNRVADIRRYSE